MDLLKAAYEGHFDNVKRLIEIEGYDVNYRDDKGRTPLRIFISINKNIE